MRMCSLKMEHGSLRHALGGRLRAGPDPIAVNILHIGNTRHDDLSRLQRTMRELLPDQNVSEPPPLIVRLGRLAI